MPANMENSAVATGLEKVVFIPIPKKGNAKECSNYCTIALISPASNDWATSLHFTFRIQWCVNQEHPDVQAGFRKGRGTIDQVANIHWIIEKAKEFQKNIYFCFFDCAEDFDCVNHNNLWKILKEVEYQTTLLVSWKTCMPVKKQQLEPGMKHQTGSKSRQEYVKPVYCHPAYLIYMQSTSHEMPD